jgi:transcriptional regulator with XRE-family HTH domain
MTKHSVQISATYATLRQLLKARGLGPGEIAEALGVSERSLRRWFSDGGLTLEQLEKLCALVQLSVFDLYELASRTAEYRPKRLTLRQERELAEDYVLIFVFVHLLNGWRPSELEREANMPPALMIVTLSRLEKIGLIENLPGGHVKLMTAREIEWHENGPMRRHVQGYINYHFNNLNINEHNFLGKTESLKLSVASIAEIESKFAKLMDEIRDMARIDMTRASTDKRWYAILLAARSVVFGASLFKQSPSKQACEADG